MGIEDVTEPPPTGRLIDDAAPGPLAVGDATAARAAREERFAFTGTAGEYFGIWIVNILLTILTLGIYSAWAKVRRNRFLYGSTELAGRRFDYHATGLQILVGRIIVLTLLVLYQLVLNFAGAWGLAAVPLFLAFVPWAVSRGLRFSARVTSYRTVRFDFDGGYWGAARAYLLGPLLGLVTLGILAPLASKWMARYRFGHLHWGDRPFANRSTTRGLYAAWWLPAVLFVLGLAAGGSLLFLIGDMMLAGSEVDPENPLAAPGFVAFLLSIYVLLFLLFGLSGSFYETGIRNITYSQTVVDDRHRLLSDMSRPRWVWILASNLVVTLLSAGLMRPWAVVRAARYQAAHTALLFDGEPGEVLSRVVHQGSVAGAEFMDFEGFDVGF